MSDDQGGVETEVFVQPNLLAIALALGGAAILWFTHGADPAVAWMLAVAVVNAAYEWWVK